MSSIILFYNININISIIIEIIYIYIYRRLYNLSKDLSSKDQSEMFVKNFILTKNKIFNSF